MNEAEVLAVIQLATAIAPLLPQLITQLQQDLHPAKKVDLTELRDQVNAGFAKVLGH